MEQLLDFPLFFSATLLFSIAMIRGQATYWLARMVTQRAMRGGVGMGGWRASVSAWVSGEAVGRGRQAVERFGVVVVPACYLTVGLQTVVLAAAGCLRLKWITFTVAQIPGALAWALIYTTVGFAVWGAAIGAVAGNPVVLLSCAALAGVILVLLFSLRLRRMKSVRCAS